MMNIGFVYWLAILLWFFFGLFLFWPIVPIVHFLLLILFFLLGWKVFGFPIRGW